MKELTNRDTSFILRVTIYNKILTTIIYLNGRTENHHHRDDAIYLAAIVITSGPCNSNHSHEEFLRHQVCHGDLKE